jgi:ethanolamine ammonia-lyase small subunit
MTATENAVDAVENAVGAVGAAHAVAAVDLEPLRPLDPVRPALAAATPARVFLGRVGTTLRTRDLLALRVDHAAARDAVHARLDDESGALEPLVVGHGMFTVATQAHTPHAYLRRPDLGRLFSEEGAARIRAEGTREPTVQLIVADGLSARAVGSYAPPFVETFTRLGEARGWTLGRPIAVRHARVGLMNEVGELLHPQVVVLLIGERPGLDVQASMSAYFGYRPTPSCTDADRSLISNIRDDGIPADQAASDAISLVDQILATGGSGVSALLAAHDHKHLTGH